MELVSVYILALDIRHANRILSEPVLYCNHVWFYQPYSSTLSHTRHKFRERKLCTLNLRYDFN